jgi:UDP-N-acetylbacillosamine N-acetyltransferase
MKRPLLVLGCGGHGKVVADAALVGGTRVLGFADDAERWRGGSLLGLPVLAIGRAETLALCRKEGAEIVLAIGDNRTRQRVFRELLAEGLSLATVIHPTAIIAPSATVGIGTVVFAGTIVNADARIGQNVILNTGVRVDHDNVIGDHAHLSPGVTLGGTVTVGEGTHLAVGVSVRNNVAVGAWSVVGVGAAVVGAIPDEVVAFGTPAKVVRRA